MININWQNLINVFAVFGVIISLYFNVYIPWAETKPDLECYTVSHCIGDNTAITLILIRNKGDEAATNVGIYYELERSDAIKEICSNPEYNLVEGGEADWRVKMTWDRLEPGNSLKVSIFTEADPTDISSIVPVALRIWSDAGIIEDQGGG